MYVVIELYKGRVENVTLYRRLPAATQARERFWEQAGFKSEEEIEAYLKSGGDEDCVVIFARGSQ